MNPQAVRMHKGIRKFLEHTQAELEAAEAALKAETDLKELADWCQALRRIWDFADALRKDFGKLHDLAQTMTCALWTHQANGQPIRTEHTTATPEVQFRAKVPKRDVDPERYYALCESLGISRDVADTEAFRIHWPGFCELLGKLAREGKPLPAGLDPSDLAPVYRVVSRSRKGVEE